MKPLRLSFILGGLLASVIAAQAQFTWTGLGANRDVATAGNWRGNTPPPNDGSATIALDHAINNTLLLSADYNFNAVTLNNNDDYLITAASAHILTLNGGLTASTITNSRLILSANITLNLVGPQTMDAGASSIIVNGHITGSSPLSLLSTSGTGNGVFVFNNTGTGNTYTGNTTLGDGVNYVGVAFWNASPFGTGSVTANSGSGTSVQLIAHGTQTITNAFTFSGPGSISLRSWDAPLTYSGNVTLATNTTFGTTATQNFLAAPAQDGSVPMPGLATRQPIVFSGNISGASTLTTNGPGVLELTGTNTYTNGTTVGGSTVFGSSSSSPGVVNILAQGYAGDATPGNFASFLTHINVATSAGGIGLDSLSGTNTFSDAIDLSSFSSGVIRVGSATSAIYNGLLTPQGTNYQFGNGGGVLYVTSNLGGSRGLSMNNASQIPLTLFLQGTNAYTLGTTVNNGFVVFDAFYSLPISGALVAAGASTIVGNSYIGYTELIQFATPAAFLSNFTKATTWGIVGFDTHAGNPTVSITNVDLTGFNDGVFIGTTTSANIDATTLTGTTVANGSNAANTLRFTASRNGVLTVNGAITGGKSVMIGSPYDGGSPYAPYSSGTVVLNGASTYTGGTTLNAMNFSGPTLEFDTANALGTGNLTVATSATNGGGLVALQAGSGSLILPNNIVLQNAGVGGPQLYFTGTNAFTLSGMITGDNTSSLTLYNPVPLSVSLAGNNSGFLGDINAYNGTLTLKNDNAAGLGNLLYGGGAMTVTFGGAATNPYLYGIKGAIGNLIIPGGTNLHFDVSDDVTHDSEFGGVVSGAGSVIVLAPTAVKAEVLYLSGNNTYSGGSTISGNNAVMALGSNTAAGTGTVTVNAPTGGLILNSGVTFTNNLVFTTGALGGFGTFSPAGGPLTFDTGRTVIPGLGNLSKDSPVGTLTFGNNVTFGNGGAYVWSLQDVTRTDGASLINITGNLDITATGGGFNFLVFSFDATGNQGLANLSYGTPYSIQVLHATGAINGFSPTDFTINGSQFQNDPGAVFTLTNVGSDLFLNFTAVPEPSTYALLGLGLGAVLFPALRRRKRVGLKS